ncbi:MAG: hypothetical protein OSB43_22175 [Nocardioides sp.]|uniref:hypothetical protein n=1 Tax=Nocardioides sp. TaxID=35761 RepID=UPI000C9128DC|nr:hypothetical protein [Nocardioides sp.]MAS54539.1 hypothetical protein [Pimelobacter sp.]MDE0778998.1 hypothetical protein [Nocardioides sp.]
MFASLSLRVPVVLLEPRRTRDARRLRRVARDPSRATVADLELLVRAHGVPERLVWAVTDRFDADDLDPEQAWRWTMTQDGTELALLCASHITGRELAWTLAGESALGVARAG